MIFLKHAICALALLFFSSTTVSAAELKKNIWYKSCKGTACYTSLKVSDKTTVVLMVDPAKRQPMLMLVSFYPDADIVKGMTWQIDTTPIVSVPYMTCLPRNKPTVCNAQLAVNDAYVATLKRRNTLHITGVRKGKTVLYDVSLAGFASAYDGPSTVDLATLEAFSRN